MIPEIGHYAPSAHQRRGYGLTAFVLVVNATYPLCRRRRLLREIAQSARRDDARVRG